MAKRIRKREKESRVARLELEAGLREVKVLLQQAYLGFNACTDSELTDYYIYEIQALQARYSYLLRQRKALDGEPVMTPGAPAPVM